MEPFLSAVRPSELGLLKPIQDHICQVVVGCILRELVLVRDLTLQEDDASLNKLKALPPDWADEAFAKGTSNALPLIEADATSSKEEIERFVAVLNSVRT